MLSSRCSRKRAGKSLAGSEQSPERLTSLNNSARRNKQLNKRNNCQPWRDSGPMMETQIEIGVQSENQLAKTQ
jgi:hypothetical protein